LKTIKKKKKGMTMRLSAGKDWKKYLNFCEKVAKKLGLEEAEDEGHFESSDTAVWEDKNGSEDDMSEKMWSWYCANPRPRVVDAVKFLKGVTK
jgi:hypothetical protein